MKRLKWCCCENAAGALNKIITREKLVNVAQFTEYNTKYKIKLLVNRNIKINMKILKMHGDVDTVPACSFLFPRQ